MDILIRNVHALTVDESSREIPDACIAIQDGKILSIGPEAPEGFAPQRVIDGRGKLAIPGFINTHTHCAMTYFRGYGSDLNLQDWLETKIWPAEDRMGPGDCYVGSQVGIAEMLMGGTTTFLDMYAFMEETARAVGESGIRAALTRAIIGNFGDFEGRKQEARALYREFHNAFDGRITTMVAPHAEYTSGPEHFCDMVAMAQEMGVGMHVHVAETKSEVAGCYARHGVSPVEFLADVGVFERPCVAAHCVVLSERDIALLAEHHVSVAHNPRSNMKLSSGIAPVQRLLDAGVNVGIGTDGASSNNRLDMLADTSAAALLGKLERGDPRDVNAQTALRMATINGARALGLGDTIGSLEAGKDADIVLFDTERPWWYPKGDMTAQLIYAAHSTDVCLTMVNGEILYEDGELKTIDLPRALAELSQRQKHMY